MLLARGCSQAAEVAGYFCLELPGCNASRLRRLYQKLGNREGSSSLFILIFIDYDFGMNLHAWSWLFLVLYIVAMTGFGYVGSRRVSGADDYAIAQAGYGFCRDISWADCGAGNSARFLGNGTTPGGAPYPDIRRSVRANLENKPCC